MAEDFHLHAQISDHFADDLQLLIVFLTEDRHMRADHVEQLRHRCGDAAKMPRSRGAAERQTELLDFDEGLGAVWIHLCQCRMKNNIDLLCLEQLAVALKIARVRGEIFPRPKLGWIDKNGYRHSIRALFRSAHQR